MAEQSDLEARIIQIEDREAISRLIQDNALLLDVRDLAGYSQLFAEDGELRQAGKVSVGRAAIQATLESGLSPQPPAPGPTRYHVVWSPRIDLDGDRATSRTNWAHVLRLPEDLASVPTLGHYDDEFTKINGRWYFQSRAINRDIPDRPV